MRKQKMETVGIDKSGDKKKAGGWENGTSLKISQNHDGRDVTIIYPLGKEVVNQTAAREAGRKKKASYHMSGDVQETCREKSRMYYEGKTKIQRRHRLSNNKIMKRKIERGKASIVKIVNKRVRGGCK